MEWFIWIVLAIVMFIAYAVYADKKKRERLINKYGDPEIVESIMNNEVWQGATEEHVIDSLGKPLDIDQKVLKTKIKEVWKYEEVAKNRYALKVIIENGIVVGWDKK
ncbi:hypothetical protein [Sulfurimonas sp.]|uniref:hypothetical protein n=1 Tax=Sulfurimonas sp. TaxID=2022749 RepID=UPI0035677D78